MVGRDITTPKHEFSTPVFRHVKKTKENCMKVKINEDWLATIIAFLLLILSMINFIKPDWVKF